MTREEAKQVANTGKTIKTVDSQCAVLIDKIYDDFESRTCENCTYFTPPTKFLFAACEKGVIENEELADNYEKTRFGCNKWAKAPAGK